MTAPEVASSKTWQVSVVGWPLGGDGIVVGGLVTVGMVFVVVNGDGVTDGDRVGGGGGC